MYICMCNKGKIVTSRNWKQLVMFFSLLSLCKNCNNNVKKNKQMLDHD